MLVPLLVRWRPQGPTWLVHHRIRLRVLYRIAALGREARKHVVCATAGEESKSAMKIIIVTMVTVLCVGSWDRVSDKKWRELGDAEWSFTTTHALWSLSHRAKVFATSFHSAVCILPSDSEGCPRT